MAKPGPHPPSKEEAAKAREDAKNETIWYIASQGDQKAKDALKENNR